MKIKYFLMLLFCALAWHSAFAQFVLLSYPIEKSVMQRNSSDMASVTVAGQVVSSSLLATVGYRFRPLSATGVAGAAGPTTTLPLTANGMFFGTTTMSKGWYLCEIIYNGIVYASSRFGIGDVFIIAGQSNAQGMPDPNWALPTTTSYPEWIVGSSDNKTCTKNLPEIFGTFFSFSNASDAVKHGSLSPTGNTIWCYGVLGKLISEANGGMPVAFFNAASGGSTVTQWYQGSQGIAAPNGYLGGAQFCDVGKYQGPFIGQPYTPLKSALNYYGSIFGVRGILWHQGEADSDAGLGVAYKVTSSADYANKLTAVINKSRVDFANPNLAWFISNASITNGQAPNATVRAGQISIANAGVGVIGPDSDYNGAATTQFGWRADCVHFAESKKSALTWLGTKWFNQIGANGLRVEHGFVPSLTYSKNGNLRSLAAPAGYAEYRWGNEVNGAIAGATTNVFTTDQVYAGIRCFIKDSNGNWHASQRVNVGQYSSQRETAKIDADESIGPGDFEWKIFPNPSAGNITIEFEVDEDNSKVRLEILDRNGAVVKTIVENPHAKGHWEYPVSNFDDFNDGMHYVRLKVNEMFMTKRIFERK
jgi:hypothetical protein